MVASASSAASSAAHSAYENPTVKSYCDSVNSSMSNLQHVRSLSSSPPLCLSLLFFFNFSDVFSIRQSVMQTKAEIEEETKRRIAEEQMASTEPVLLPEGEREGDGDDIVEGHPHALPPVGDNKQDDLLL